MDIVSKGGHLEISRTRTGETILGTCVGELGCDGGSRYVVRIERAGVLALCMLGFNLRGRSDARQASYPWECYGAWNDH